MFEIVLKIEQRKGHEGKRCVRWSDKKRMPFIAANAYASHWSVFRVVDRKGAGWNGGIYLEKLGTDILPSAGDSYGTVRQGRSAAAPTLFVSVAIFQGF